MNEIVIPALYLLAGICGYAAINHITVGLSQPLDRTHLLFACICLLTVLFAIFHAYALKATDIAEFVWGLKLSLASAVMLATLFIWFIALYTARRPLALLAGLSALFAVLFIVNVMQPYGLQYDHIDGIHTLQLPWGETVTRGDGHNGGWAYITIAAATVAFGYALYALGSVYYRYRRLTDLFMLLAVVLFTFSTTVGILVRLSILNFIEPGPFGILAVVLFMSVALTQETHQRLRVSERRFRSLVEQAPFSIQVLAPDGYTRLVNTAWETLWGSKLERLANYNILQDQQLIEKGVMPYIEQSFAGKAAEIPPVVYNPADNLVAPGPARDRWVQSHIYPIKDESGAISDVILVHQDVTERKRAEDSLRESETRFRTINEQSPIGMAFGRDGYTVDVNPVYLQMFGYDDVAEVIGQPLINQIAPQCRAEVEERIKRRIQNQPTEATYETTGLRKDGSQFPLFVSAKRVVLSDGPLTYAFLIDFTERHAAEEKIRHLAFYDHLTDLPNRRLFMDRLQQSLAASARSARNGALLLIDLDNFKTLNDTLGHDMGDWLLQQIAQRLETCVREGDTVSRFGGDEFVVMLEDLNEHAVEAAAQAEAIGEKILVTLSQPYQLASHEVHSTSSIGVTLFGGHKQAIEEFLKQADIAMYQAKKTGRNLMRFFDPQMQEAINTRADLEGELRKALEGQQFKLYYQIQRDSSNRSLGAEALIRWIHPERGVMSPAQFIELAEETGLILPIGQWVIHTACAQLQAWQHETRTRDLVLCVNVSAKQFHQADFARQLQATVERHAIDPKLLKLELTESLLLEDSEGTIATMNALKKLGVQFSLDDFGTGYSSLQYLKRLPLDQLKIDQSFVRDIVTDNSDKAIVRTIIAMAQSLNLDVIAEGVETEEQRQLLLGSGCTQYQGYLFSRPIPVEMFEALLKQG